MRTHIILLTVCLYPVIFFGCHTPSGTQILEKLNQVPTGAHEVEGFAFFGPDNKSVIACFNDLRQFSCPDLKLVATVNTRDGLTFGADITKDRSVIVLGTGTEFMEMRSTTDLTIKHSVPVTFLVPHHAGDGSSVEPRWYRVAFSGDDKYVALGTGIGDEVSIWKTDGMEEVLKVQLDSSDVRAVAFSNDGKTVAICTTGESKVAMNRVLRAEKNVSLAEPTIFLFDVPSKTQIGSFRARQGDYYEPDCMIFTPDDQYLLSGSNDKNITIWDWKKGQVAGVLSGGHSATVQNIKFFRDNRHLASVGADGALCIWDYDTRTLITKAEIGQEWTRGLDISDDGKMIVTSGVYITLFIVNLP